MPVDVQLLDWILSFPVSNETKNQLLFLLEKPFSETLTVILISSRLKDADFKLHPATCL